MEPSFVPFPEPPTATRAKAPCGVVDEYKAFMLKYFDSHYHILADDNYRGMLETWTSCCPEFTQRVKDLQVPAGVRGKKNTLEFTINRENACEQAFFHPLMEPGSPAIVWRDAQAAKVQTAWIERYSNLSLEIQGCCVRHLVQECLQKPPSQLTDEAWQACSKRWSPFRQANIDGESLQRLTQEQTKTAALVKDHAALRREHEECQRGLEKAAKEQQVLLSERQGLENSLLAAFPRSGVETLAGFPVAAGSVEVVVWGLLAIAGGFFLGLPVISAPGRRLLAGILAALLSLFLYGTVVALLPDTRFPFLLLAAAVALLLISLIAVWRTHRLSTQRTGSPP